MAVPVTSQPPPLAPQHPCPAWHHLQGRAMPGEGPGARPSCRGSVLAEARAWEGRQRKEAVRTPCAAFSRSHMEPEPYGAGATGSTVSAGGWEPPPAARRGGGHALPTCLGRHRGAEERLETGGAELADRPHAAGVPRRMPPAPGGQGRDGQKSGRSREATEVRVAEQRAPQY